MKIPATFFRSKVAHRIVLLFVSCALLPVTILAIVSFHEVSSQLREQSQKQLTHASKGQGMAIYERLEMLDSDLQLISSQVSAHRSLAIGQVLQSHFQGVAVFAADGSQRAHWGNALASPQLTFAEKKHLLSGNSLLQLGNCSHGSGNCVSMLRMAHTRGSETLILVGELSPDYLWASRNLLPGLEFCVLSASRSVLFCSDDRMDSSAALPAFNHASGFYQWQRDSTLYDAAYWKVMIRPMFFQEPWTVAVSQEHADALAPMLRFRQSFPLVILLSLWIVMFFSMIQIRRTLGPLKKLQEGTRDIGSGQFESRVEVHSGDEFEGLASSFNSMAAQLGRQFHALKAIHEIDQAMFASLNREAIVDGVLASMPRLLPSDCFAVCVFNSLRSSGWLRYRDVDTGAVHTETTGIAGHWTQLQNNPLAFRVTGQQNIPEYLLPLSLAGMRSFLVLPIRVDDSTEAVLVCAQRETCGAAVEDMQEARQVADQLAVAFSHVHLIEALEQQHLGTLTALARAIDAKSEWTAGHSERVTNLAVEIGRNMGLSPQDLKVMHRGGLLHDIGKIGTPPTILDKPGLLSPDEMRIMQNHVHTGLRILEPIPGFREALPIIAQHHEWFNGKGYPEGIAGKNISLYARIFAVADCYDAITSDRPYRNGVSAQQTLEILQKKSGEQFDPDVIDVFVRMMAEKMPEPKAKVARAGKSE